jgi:hypothetical protein
MTRTAKLLRVLSASTHIGGRSSPTPETPAERVAALRKAFDTMVHDPRFIEAGQAREVRHRADHRRGDAEDRRRDDGGAAGASERLQKIIE